MASLYHLPIFSSLLVLVLLHGTLPNSSFATTRKLTSLFQLPALVLNYHNGPLLKGTNKVNLYWYGNFSSTQRSIITDFIQSMNPANSPPSPSVASWWQTTANYKDGPSNIVLGKQIIDENYSLGKSLTTAQVLQIASTPPHKYTIGIVLTAADVTVDQFCMICGSHTFGYSNPKRRRGKYAVGWAGNPVSQCPGECAWPLAQAEFGPQTPPLGAPNGDVGMDGMVMNLATILAGAVTNPFDNGYFQGPASAPLEAVSACTGIYGSGAYSGYPGLLLVDSATGASYNCQGVNGRKYLLPAMWDPNTSQCRTLV